MASRGDSEANGSSLIGAGDAPGGRFVFIYDRRTSNKPEVRIDIESNESFVNFKEKACKACTISAEEKFVVTTTNREEIKDDSTLETLVRCRDTLYILESIDQDLIAPAQERVSYLPHYDTIVKGGMYEYYASEGQNPLPYAFAELIDNALAATVDNPGPRTIELKVHIDEASPSRNAIFVIDNGKGMSSHQLNNWAIYRLSKFNRKEFKGAAQQGSSPHPFLQMAPRSLNSDISYFGVGGKQAIFFIGSSTRMISKPRSSKDVHELTISKEEFERREKNHESIYTGFISNRKVGDASHIASDDEMTRSIITGEKMNDSFTCVCIHGINPVHMNYLKHFHKEWTRQLAHIYHYYIHGPEGNVGKPVEERSQSPFGNINLDVTLTIKHSAKDVKKININLRDIDDDMQSLYIQKGANTFEFKAVVEGTGVVEGLLRYHPFLYDRETYPTDDHRVDPDLEDEHDYALPDGRSARGKRPIFECFWNGRLIPYTTIDDFDWCGVPKKIKSIPAECYNRISGVLWTNDKFQVSTNKLTFIDLEMKLRDKNTAYARILGKQEKRTTIEKEFTNWLKDCHEHCDKQIRFGSFKGQITRSDLPKSRHGPWSVYEHIEWDGRVYKKGDMVKITRLVPVLYGSIKRILLYGDHEGEVYATGGDLEVIQEPQCLYEEVRIVPLSKVDRSASAAQIEKYLEDEEAKLPDRLVITWPSGDAVTDGEKRPAGKTIGDLKVEIANRRGELINKLPGSSSKKLLVELKVIWHSPNGDEVIVSHISQHGKNWPYWFRKMENVRQLGSHTLQLQAVLNETGANTYAGKTLPVQRLKFTVTEAEPEKFTVGMLEGPFRIGVPFHVPLEFQDEFGNPTKPSNKLKPVLTADDLNLTYTFTQVKGNTLIIKDIVAVGAIESSSGQNFHLTVTVPGLDDSHTLKIRLLPGPPHSIKVMPEERVEIENGEPVEFEVEVHDQAGTVTSQSKLSVTCKFSGSPGLPSYTVDCSSLGRGKLTGPPLNIKKFKGKEEIIMAKIDVPSCKSISAVERQVRITPSSRAASIEVSYTDEHGKSVPIKPGMDIFGIAGDMITGITFRLIDEAGRAAEIDSSFVSKLKCNWIQKLDKDVAKTMTLPDIKVPNLVSESKYCNVSVTDGSGIELNFNIKGIPGDPDSIRCRCQGKTTLRMGEKLNGDILVSVLDKHGNNLTKLDKVKGVLSDLSVTGDGLNTSEMVRALGQSDGFNIHGVKFDSGSLGTRELCVTWRGLTDYVRLQMSAGPPSQLMLPGWDLSQPAIVYNEHKLPRAISVQLGDEAGNPSPESGVRVTLHKDAAIKLAPTPQVMKTDSKGVANFGVFSISGKSGVYEIQPRCNIGRTTLTSPSLEVSIQPDLTKPVSLVVEYDKSTSYTVGGDLPDFTVKVLTEEDNVLTTAKSSCISMKMWQLREFSTKPPSNAQQIQPDNKRKNDKDGVFFFSNRKVPERSGSHCIMFIYNDQKSELFSNQITISVQPGPPCKLMPVQMPGTPTVSNTKNSSSRTLIRTLKFQLKDSYNNDSGFDINGTLTVEILCDGTDKDDELPQFVGGQRLLEFPVSKGQTTLQNLTIMENSSGKDGAEYTLRCTVNSSSIPKNQSIPAYDISFLFYNDAKKQSQMAALTRERDSLQSAIKTYKSIFETTTQLINELKISLSEAQAEESKLKQQLSQAGIQARAISTPEAIDSLIAEKGKERDDIMRAPRRMCSVQPVAKHPDILGKIAHLAQVREHDIARVLSWHMSADMDCVVTITTKKAKEIYQQSGGKQQVLPLDSIYKKNLPDWNKPLPHERIIKGWRPQGNPVYARNLLEFPHSQDNCRVVFGMLLGDTIILDTLDHANSYRQEIVKYTHCPTILTRDGDRIRSNGKFGGLMNKALPIERLKGVVFEEPLSDKFTHNNKQIDLLQNHKAAMQKRLSAMEDLQEQVNAQKDPDMQAKLRECQEAEEQLRDIELKLGVSPSPGANRNRMSRSSVDEPTPKRGRLSLPSSQNGDSEVDITPSRTSRRASGTPMSPPESRKRMKRT